MTVSKSRGTSKKLGPIGTGHAIVRFDVPNLTRRFAVHEDLICRTSAYFKSRLQRNRKEVTDSCSICFEDLDAAIRDIKFCDECGQNFHEDCADKWSLDRLQTGQPVTCPICRGGWGTENPQNLEVLRLVKDLDVQAVQVYLDWLYSGTVNIDASIPRTTDAFNLALLQCWEVSDAVEDSTFRDDIIRKFFTEAKAHFWGKSVNFAFVQGKASELMRKFVVDIFRTRLEDGWFATESGRWPAVFVKSLADHLLRDSILGLRRSSFEDVKMLYLPVHRADTEEVVDLASECVDDMDDNPPSLLSRNPQLPETSRESRKGEKDVAGGSVRTERLSRTGKYAADRLSKIGQYSRRDIRSPSASFR